MVDIQTTAQLVDLAVKGVTILLMIAAAALAIKKKNNLILGIAVVGNLAAYYFFQSPLVCMIISLGCMIWAGMSKSNIEPKTERKEEKMIKCRFCKKLYGSEYDGCPYCKKV